GRALRLHRRCQGFKSLSAHYRFEIFPLILYTSSMSKSETGSQARIESIIGSSSLSPAAREGVRSITRSRLDRWNSLIGEHIGQNPRIHFTTDTFTYTSDTSRDHRLFLELASASGWNLQPQGNGIRVQTGIVEGISQNGLRSRSCVAAMPEGPNDILVRSHPRLLLEGFRRTIINFSKHAIPYKQTPVRRTHGTISDLVGAMVVVGEDVAVEEQGRIPRTRMTDGNFLKPRTHLTQEISSIPSAIIRFSVSQDVYSNGGLIWIDKDSMAGDVYAGLRSALLSQQFEAVTDYALKYLSLLSCFQPARTEPAVSML
ncbi:MAG: hypothetical protein ACD_37C00457G0006, partial [uncultured bacterium]